jgi:hypothetical protein
VGVAVDVTAAWRMGVDVKLLVGEGTTAWVGSAVGVAVDAV